MSESQEEEPRAAASVILVREGESGVEVYLLRRHRKASFMASSYVFPGGIADAGESDPRMTAARELFEESGILLSRDNTSSEQREAWRTQLNTPADADEITEEHSKQLKVKGNPFPASAAETTVDLDAMHYFAHWITPSVEKRRYSAKFFIALMPEGQVASPDNKETVDEVWVTPTEAIERSKELNLPPPQLRTMYELVEPAEFGLAGVLKEAEARAEQPHAILPRACASADGLTLLMPWDAQYESEGNGASLPIAEGHPLAWGPTRFVLKEGAWLHTVEPETLSPES
jgi:8-oxo-dGTP pyrophosphatase MutT (NUDIX family)